MLNPTQLFSLFEDNPKILLEEEKISPHLLIKIFKKIISNYSKFSDNLIISLVGNNFELDSTDIINAGYYISFNKAFECISKLDIEDPKHIEALRSLNLKNDLKNYLDMSIQFFSNYEEYEKCLILQNIYLELISLPF